MPRYYFDWELAGNVKRDPKGMTFSDLATAIEVATDCACDLAADEINRGETFDSGSILVRDATQMIVHRISLAAARTLTKLTDNLMH